jgi:hypothetical protein
MHTKSAQHTATGMHRSHMHGHRRELTHFDLFPDSSHTKTQHMFQRQQIHTSGHAAGIYNLAATAIVGQ